LDVGCWMLERWVLTCTRNLAIAPSRESALCRSASPSAEPPESFSNSVRHRLWRCSKTAISLTLLKGSPRGEIVWVGL
jgi:hypothetical protein